MKYSWRPATRQIHAADAANPTSAITAPVFQSATYRFASPEAIAEAAITALLQRLTQPQPDSRVFKIVHVDSTLVKAGPGVKEKW